MLQTSCGHVWIKSAGQGHHGLVLNTVYFAAMHAHGHGEAQMHDALEHVAAVDNDALEHVATIFHACMCVRGRVCAPCVCRYGKPGQTTLYGIPH